jgi:hypothetical protein
MKKLLLKTAALLLLTNTVMAQDISLPTRLFTPFHDFSRVIKDTTHKSVVPLNKDTVRCSHIGYGASELKIGIPSLRWEAALDHSNGENLGPCVTAGMSFCGGFGGTPSIPEELLDADNPTETVDVQVVLNEQFVKNEESCTRTLVENVFLNVRGIDFNHQRIKEIGEISLQECEAIF